MKKFLLISGTVSVFVALSGVSGYLLYNKENIKVLQSSKIVQASNTPPKFVEGARPYHDDKDKPGNYQLDHNEQRPDNNTSQPPSHNGIDTVVQKSGAQVQDRPLYPKEVFLTFDDGPSVNTEKILKILDDNNVKASFFVVGKNVDSHPELVMEEYKDNMTVLNHSYDHNYAMYSSVDAFLSDFNKGNDSIKASLGIEPLRFMRFPGGSDNKVGKPQTLKDIRALLVNNGIEYVDWNVSSGDAAAVTVPAETLKSNLLRQLSASNFAVVLMHDAPAKTTTVDALPAVIDYLKKQGFVFRTFGDLTPTEEKAMIKRRIINRGMNR